MCELITEIAAASIKPAVTKSVRFAGVSDDGSKGSAGSGSPAKAGSTKGETLSLLVYIILNIYLHCTPRYLLLTKWPGFKVGNAVGKF